MEINQIYNVVNDITAQAIGGDLAVVDDVGLVALGNTILDSSSYTDNFLNTMVKRIGKTIISSRAYKNQFSGLMKDSMEFGAIVQKLKVQLISAEADESYNLEDGKSVDHYKVAKPKAVQKLFITETPYQFKITIQREHLKEAFLNAAAMGAFISAVYTEVQNSIELAIENLGRTTLANYIAEVDENETRTRNLVTEYNAKAGTTLTADTAVFDEAFLRYAIAEIKKVSKKMQSMTNIFNDGTTTRHTPLSLQKMYVLSDFETALETQVEYAAFNKGYVDLNGFEELAYLQGIKEPSRIDVKRASDGVEKSISNVVACIFDTEALGLYNQDEWTSTTPMNAAGGYFNTYWHEKQLWFNDLSENFVVFTLN